MDILRARAKVAAHRAQLRRRLRQRRLHADMRDACQAAMDFERRNAAMPAAPLPLARRGLFGAGAKLARAFRRVLAGRIVRIAVEQRIAEAGHGLPGSARPRHAAAAP